MKNFSKQSGFSIVELILVVVMISVLAGIVLMTFRTGDLLTIDDQSRKIMDYLDEARQRALNQRQIMRIEINRTQNRIILIDENTPNNATDDAIIKSLPLNRDITVGVAPINVPTNPTATSPIPVANYQTTNYPLSNGEEKITLRFRRNGQVSDAGTDNIGTGSLVTGATIYLSTNKLVTSTNTNTGSIQKPAMVRAVAVLGTSGDTSLYRCSINSSGDCVNWFK